MADFKATIDPNMHVVVEWVSKDTGERIDVPRTDWKNVNDWSYEEILELFGIIDVDSSELEVSED